MTTEQNPDTDDSWPLRRHHGWRPEPAMGELLRYSGDPDMLAGAEVAQWAYSTIRELAGMVRALAGQDGPPVVSVGQPVWRTGRSVEPRVTLYRDDQIAGILLTAELAAEVVARCNAVDIETTETTVTEFTLTVGDTPLELSPRALALLIRMARAFDTHDPDERTPDERARAHGLLPLPDDVEPELLRVAMAHASAVLDMIDPEAEVTASVPLSAGAAELAAEATISDPE